MKSKLAWRGQWSLKGLGQLPSTQNSVTPCRQKWLIIYQTVKFLPLKQKEKKMPSALNSFSMKRSFFPESN